MNRSKSINTFVLECNVVLIFVQEIATKQCRDTVAHKELKSALVLDPSAFFFHFIDKQHHPLDCIRFVSSLKI